MTDQELAQMAAKALIEGGFEGGYGSVSRSTAGDYPSMGASQWEGLGGRGDNLLSYIDGGDKFAGRTYSDIANSGQLPELSALLDSDQGHIAQQMILSNNTLSYIQAQKDIPGNDDSRVIIYIATWQPTSTTLPVRFLNNRLNRIDIHSLKSVRDIFYSEYARAADVLQYQTGYQNRAENAYQVVAGLDLSAYGVPVYGCGPYGR